MPLITRTGFSKIGPETFVELGALGEHRDGPPVQLNLPVTADALALIGLFDWIALIRIPFASSADGRGFSLARRLRDLGFNGRLRAQGRLVADQFEYALACGFDEIEIDDIMARRQPEHHWLDQLAPRPDYRAKLKRALV